MKLEESLLSKDEIAAGSLAENQMRLSPVEQSTEMVSPDDELSAS